MAQEEAGVMSREEDVQEWLAYAEADRRSAYNAMKMQDYRDAALHCQQAVEKLLKTVIVAQTGERPPYEHDLRTLLRKVRGLSVPEELARRVSDLDIHYTGTRYPGVVDLEFYTEENVTKLIACMEETFRWFLTHTALRSTSSDT
jgi:HEPN domain-containing protein